MNDTGLLYYFKWYLVFKKLKQSDIAAIYAKWLIEHL